MDELASGRQLRDDLRQLKERYPELTTPTAQARLTAYMRTQTDDICIPIERKERPMPAKGQRSFGEDVEVVTVRIPKSDMAFIDQYVLTLQRLHRYTRQGRSDAVRDLIQKGIDSIEHPTPQFPVMLDAPQLPLPTPVEPAATTAGGAIPPAPAYEARALTPDLEDDLEDQPLGPEPPRTIEPPAVTEDVRPARRGRPARPTPAVATTSQATPKPKATRTAAKGRK